ncbi:putative sulfate transporter 3.4 [Capsicum annuum]|nr:putative sulfate transporter 3.4 [Capsicum annuum]
MHSIKVEDASGRNNNAGDGAEASSSPSENAGVHKVCLPPHRTTFQKLGHRLSEIFFPDDPLHRFKNQTGLRKFVLGLQFFFPIFEWGPKYNLTLLRSDIIAGITIASLSIPQGISYAKLANLPPILGLYSSFVPPLIYSILGSSRHLAVGPVSICSLVMGTMIGQAISYAKEPTVYLQVAFTATLFSGLLQAAMGFFRLGFIIDFLSKATLLGFMAGAAVIVSLQQLKGLLGIVHFTNKMQIIPVLISVFEHKNEWTWQTIVMGACFLIFLLTARQITHEPRDSSAAQIGHLPKGVNPPSVNKLHFGGPHLALGLKVGIITGVLALTEGIAIGRTFAAMENYQVDGNKEMIALGLMNIVGSCASCFVTTGSFSRSAVSYNAGGKTVVSNIVMAITVLITLLFLMPLFHYTPNLILAAIIITAVVGLIDYQGAFRLWKVDKLDCVACLSSFFGVLFISVPIGLAIAVGVSVFKILLNVTRPNTHVLGYIASTRSFQSLSRYDTAVRIPSFLIIAVEAPFYFANSTYLQERTLRWIREEEDRIKANQQPAIKCVVIDMTAVTAIDTSGIDTICELRRLLEKRSLKLVLANPVGNVMEKLFKSNSLEAFGLDGLYLTVSEAVDDISSSWKPEKPSEEP